jgi:hypothetical protein
MSNNSYDAYLKGTVEPKIDTIDGFHDVPSADSADNVVMSDVIGNKTDTEAGDSLYGIMQSLLTNSFTIATGRAPGNIAQGGLLPLFTVTGVVEVLHIYGFVTDAIQNQPNATKLVANPTGGADIDLCATLDIDNDGPGTQYSVTGTFTDALQETTGAAWEGGTSFLVSGGTIDMSCVASSTGQIQWAIVWRPVAPGATLVVA